MYTCIWIGILNTGFMICELTSPLDILEFEIRRSYILKLHFDLCLQFLKCHNMDELLTSDKSGYIAF